MVTVVMVILTIWANNHHYIWINYLWMTSISGYTRISSSIDRFRSISIRLREAKVRVERSALNDGNSSDTKNRNWSHLGILVTQTVVVPKLWIEIGLWCELPLSKRISNDRDHSWECSVMTLMWWKRSMISDDNDKRRDGREEGGREEEEKEEDERECSSNTTNPTRQCREKCKTWCSNCISQWCERL